MGMNLESLSSNNAMKKLISFYHTDNQRLMKKESRANTLNKGYFALHIISIGHVE